MTLTPRWADISYNAFAAYPQRSDPFALDLGGTPGLDTLGINPTQPVLFDISATGVKQSVGWLAPSDGFLALDRNGNNRIDSGAELFGDATPLSTGGVAEDGFAAVADLDSNHDQIIDSQDALWASLRVWRDLNTNGVSETGELSTLDAAGIASINVAKQEHHQLLGNGNVIADLGSYTRTDGSSALTGTAGQLADIDLAVDSFHSQFTDHIPLTAQAQTLPDMQGSGQVRSLREAKSPDSTNGVLSRNTGDDPIHGAARLRGRPIRRSRKKLTKISNMFTTSRRSAKGRGSMSVSTRSPSFDISGDSSANKSAIVV